jgi:mRNA interferase RelE/StbE
MVWKVEFDPAAEKEFAKLSSSIQREIAAYIEKLIILKDPSVRGKGLRGNKSGLWRYRVGKYRLICKIEEQRLVIFVIRVAKRDKVYD